MLHFDRFKLKAFAVTQRYKYLAVRYNLADAVNAFIRKLYYTLIYMHRILNSIYVGGFWMRLWVNEQMEVDEISISEIKINLF